MVGGKESAAQKDREVEEPTGSDLKKGGGSSRGSISQGKRQFRTDRRRSRFHDSNSQGLGKKTGT